MIRFIPMPGRSFMAIAILALFSLNGLWYAIRHLHHQDDWYLQAAFLGGAVAGAAAKGGILGGLLWLCAKGAENFHLKSPRQWAVITATTVYLIGFALGIYIFGLAVYSLRFAIESNNDGGQSATFLLVSTGLFYWFFARAISYALGR